MIIEHACKMVTVRVGQWEGDGKKKGYWILRGEEDQSILPGYVRS
jgi:hypothetical protein